MSTAIAPIEERTKVNADESALILTSGPDTEENHAFADWFRQLRFDAWDLFQKSPQPTRKDEAWRFANVKSLDQLSEYGRAQAVDEQTAADLIARSQGTLETAGRMVFANDRLLSREVHAENLAAQGVIWMPLHQALIEHADLIRKHFMTQDVVLGSKKFAALHQAMVRTGTFVYVPRNTEVALPLESCHWQHGRNGSVFPHTLIVAGENSKVTVIDRFQSADEEPGFACGVNDLYLEAGAKLTYVNVQNWNRQTLALQINSTVVGRDAAAINMALNLGGKFARTESVSRLIGEGGRSDMLALSVAEGAQEFDQRTLQDHRKPNTASDLLYKNSLNDQARTIFAGLIRVEPDSHRTDAYQKVRNLLMSDDAEANSMPGLEILADDVRCTHGATSGQIDEEELFYILSRGVPQKQAQQLIVLGFLNEVIERLNNEPIGAELRALVARKFAAVDLKLE